jgi:hypothetical protein
LASTLLNEQGWPPDAIEKQLAHIEENEVRQVYNQAKYLPVRRQMMQFWADYLDELRKGNTGAVRNFERVAAKHCGPRVPTQIPPVSPSPAPNPLNSNLLLSDSLQLSATLRFSIGASFQIAGIESLPHCVTGPTAPARRIAGEDVEIERSRRADGTFAGDDLSV